MYQEQLQQQRFIKVGIYFLHGNGYLFRKFKRAVCPNRKIREENTMADKKSSKKAPAKKKAVKKAPTKKAPAKKAPTKKAAAKKKATAKKAKKVKYTPEQVYSMIEQAAYFAAENDGFSREPAEYWAQAEAAISRMLKS